MFPSLVKVDYLLIEHQWNGDFWWRRTTIISHQMLGFPNFRNWRMQYAKYKKEIRNLNFLKCKAHDCTEKDFKTTWLSINESCENCTLFPLKTELPNCRSPTASEILWYCLALKSAAGMHGGHDVNDPITQTSWMLSCTGCFVISIQKLWEL